MSGIYTSLADEMVCPLCSDTNTHIDQVAMAARPSGEDGAITEICLVGNGDVVRGGRGIPRSRHVGEGRRQRIALYGWCESCDGAFALLFTQHKGVTLIESIDMSAQPEPLSFDREAS